MAIRREVVSRSSWPIQRLQWHLLQVDLKAGANTIVLDQRNASWRTEMLRQYDLHNSGLAYMRMLRTNEWELVRHYRANGLDELRNRLLWGSVAQLSSIACTPDSGVPRNP